MFVDEAHITVKAGDGGNGKVSFFRNKSGPDGGNGGDGGDVYAIFDPNMTTLSIYLEKRELEAESGGMGDSNRKFGKKGADLEFKVPKGTAIIDNKNGYEKEIDENNTRILICKGGKGGRGNDKFKSSTNQVPRFAEPGTKGKEKKLTLILRLIADVGFIGFPNAGKSSLLNELTAAQVKVAPYPFTTLEPNLGVCEGKIIADIPGLIEGASTGKGLGIKFLKHIEKVRLLLHCISIESEDILHDYESVRKEMGDYNKKLLEKKSIVILTKIDLIDEKSIKNKCDILQKAGIEVIPMSVHDFDRLEKLKKTIGSF
ncbi:GTPase ObgE [Candidatus Roizmanbacteria bacterium CG_4_10_14_0_8_um_filter_33_9]|uniref:GTPase Obg n=1 Tax=Candidatus Roizmanbacteria bacterium CG_4_10_14_0_8_um_filter_33_9 TaxID=1974826 RepID=A0A2M7QHG9_9BACT|nr:MAG: GTPase ObgE [Candidatus Roizmanbacteria bacterium CG_4_10_14_0_8_um_filter_33_9]